MMITTWDSRSLSCLSGWCNVSGHCDAVQLACGYRSGNIRTACSASRADMPYELSFENSNAQTSFENAINTEEKGTIYPELFYDAEHGCYHTSDFALFRLDHETMLDKRRAHTSWC